MFVRIAFMQSERLKNIERVFKLLQLISWTVFEYAYHMRSEKHNGDICRTGYSYKSQLKHSFSSGQVKFRNIYHQKFISMNRA